MDKDTKNSIEKSEEEKLEILKLEEETKKFNENRLEVLKLQKEEIKRLKNQKIKKIDKVSSNFKSQDRKREKLQARWANVKVPDLPILKRIRAIIKDHPDPKGILEQLKIIIKENS